MSSSPKLTIPAPEYTSWLQQMVRALVHGEAMPVPCGSCRACCTSSQFAHIRPDEQDTVSHIPQKLLFSAPGLPPGNKLLGYDQKGRCPMLQQNQCAIYAHRPRTCRMYDCRAFAATGFSPGPDKPLIAAQARRFQFALETQRSRDLLRATHPHTGLLWTSLASGRRPSRRRAWRRAAHLASRE